LLSGAEKRRCEDCLDVDNIHVICTNPMDMLSNTRRHVVFLLVMYTIARSDNSVMIVL
jgi:hypothetical protein